MKVKELIDQLTKTNQELDIVIVDADTNWLMNIERVGTIKEKNVIVLNSDYYAENGVYDDTIQQKTTRGF